MKSLILLSFILFSQAEVAHDFLYKKYDQEYVTNPELNQVLTLKLAIKAEFKRKNNTINTKLTLNDIK
jgi:hypothetical protein